MSRNDFENNVSTCNEQTNIIESNNTTNAITNHHCNSASLENVLNCSENTVINTEIVINATKQLNPLRRFFILEPPMFLLNFSTSLGSVVFTNQLLYQSCKVMFGHTEQECQPLLGTNATSDSKIAQQAQLYVSHIILVNSLVSSILPAILALFIGAWSDRFGRRPFLFISLIGLLIGYIVSFVLAMISTNTPTNPWLYVMAQIPAAVTGSSCAFSIVSYCYIADVAPPNLKGLKMVLNDAAIGAGLIVGTQAGSALFIKTSIQVVFAISALALLLAVIYISFVNEETLGIPHTTLRYKVCQFFSISHVVDLTRTCIAKRANHMRTFIWFTMIALIITNFTKAGENNVFYLFLQAKFNVTVSQYSNYNTIDSAIQIIGGIFAVITFRKYLHFSIVTMAILCAVSAACESTVRAAAQIFWEMYLGSALGFMAGIISPMLLTILAFITPTNETGKVFSVTTALQTITPLCASPLYTSVYDATLSYYPGMFNIISAVLYLFSFIIIGTVFIISKRKDIAISPSLQPRV